MVKILLLALFLAVNGVSAQTDSTRTLVHLLEYLAHDYGGAVSEGKVLSQTEYAEQTEFMDKAWQIHSRLSSLKSKEVTGPQMNRLRELMAAKGSPDSVTHLALNIRQEILSASDLSTSPSQWPSLVRGKELFAQNCASCHGNTGFGDGSAGAALNPPPASFHETERMSTRSPFQVFNTIRLGVEGTGMAGFAKFSDQEIWDLAFYVLSLRYGAYSNSLAERNTSPQSVSLQQLSFLSDDSLKSFLHDTTSKAIARLRLQSAEQTQTLYQFLEITEQSLDQSLASYKENRLGEARNAALKAYLEGIEPLEPSLKSREPKFVTELEVAMQMVRSSIESRRPVSEVAENIAAAKSLLVRARDIMDEKPLPPWAIFSVTVGILLREGFEAVLIILAILGVVYAAKSQKAAYYVHAGWILAVLAGFVAWFLSGWLTQMSGVSRELTEGFGSLLAVVVLLYMGFWMHSKSESRKWKAFVDGKIQTLMDGRNLLALGAFSFLVTFREAFETVLFLSALNVQGSGAGKPVLGGVVFSLALILFLAWIFLRNSQKIPLRVFFSISSFIMAILAVVLAGKGANSLQEAGILSVNPVLTGFRFELVGLFPTYETLMAQAITLIAAFAILRHRREGSPKRSSH